MSVNENSQRSSEARPAAEQGQEPRSRAELEAEKLQDPAAGGEASPEAGGEQAGEAAAEAAQDETEALRAEVAVLKDQLLRSAAELENTLRRHARDREDAVKYAASKFAKDMLEIADNLRRALDSALQGQSREELPEPVRNLVEGVEATERSLLHAFERNGIRRIDALGERFDPNLHEAMFEVEDPGQPAGTVVQVLAPGYTIHDRLLRPAQVGVSRGGQAQQRVDTKA